MPMAMKKRRLNNGCWTCRTKKVKCDSKKPFCDKCKDSGLHCDGYEVRLTWLEGTKFDKFGEQITSKSSDKNDEDIRHQRSSIKFVKYKNIPLLQQELNLKLQESENLNPNVIINNYNGTKMVFVFPVECRSENTHGITSINNTNTTVSNYKHYGSPSNIKNKPIFDSQIRTESAIVDNVFCHTNQTGYNLQVGPDDYKILDSEMLLTTIPELETISTDLREDALLSMFALQEHNLPLHWPLENSIESKKGHDSCSGTDLPNSNVKTNAIGDQSLQWAFKALFDNSSYSDDYDHNTNNLNNNCNDVHENASESSLMLNDHMLHKSPVINEHSMYKVTDRKLNVINDFPRELFEIVKTNTTPFDFNPTLMIGEEEYTIETTSLLINGLTNFLLKYFIKNVADLMIVVAASKNPWKTIYFRRALNAMGSLAGLREVSNSENSILNSVLAVSCFHLINKFQKNSKLQNYFLNLGIKFRSSASKFLNQSIQDKLQKEKYKDILCAMLAMSSVDVVWGTMTDSWQYLNLCEQFIQKRLSTKPNLSKKAKSLHEIFSLFQLIQDSTSLDKITPSEIIDFDDSTDQAVIKLYNKDGTSTNNVSRMSLNPIDIEANASGSKQNTVKIPIFDEFYQKKCYFSYSTPSRNEVLESDNPFGLPNSLILLFSYCTKIVRHCIYYKKHGQTRPPKFSYAVKQFEEQLMNWLPEWSFWLDDSKNIFINKTIEAIYHHTMSFYFGVKVYYFTMVKNLPLELVQIYVEKTLHHLNIIRTLIEKDKINVLPLFWQGFIAGCACTSVQKQESFKLWAGKLSEYGMGSYWGARQVMYEVWKKRSADVNSTDNWYELYKKKKMNLMLF
ncbi:hypothetical protein TPHA_0A06090 [Tetrapisispora phaffii CBS 4417]|uniref:Zn(2)-C6 fungal-type domain-containing protein n=1 Tax=Tetrapisispora phaffii (strain ATCC 24235 / CBS 4417 / NBRC 1672 / NRRL Y-8282 / UCD 70-5) TaxID=1071381 RepID=G8BP54_TETPH|nr:hypothetical protein TPHA_0A06090 [Tetrapisispora phaffii CBS 4417]CCE61682.1 hypothetical protein TPHA_0A06090 [Tetrapisispora phaffii CBS 4417]